MASLLTPAVPTGSFLVLRVLWFQNGLSTKKKIRKKEARNAKVRRLSLCVPPLLACELLHYDRDAQTKDAVTVLTLAES